MPVPQFVMEEGAAHIEMRAEQLDRRLEPDDWVFGNQQDPAEGLNRDSFRKWVMVPALQDAGLSPKVRTHDLRHTCASLLISLGAHPKAIQERLGHSDISVTLNLYGHLFPSLEEQLTDALDDLGRSVGTKNFASRYSRPMPKKIYGKKSGVEITDELIEQYVAEAEQGYDLNKLQARRGRPLPGRAPATTFAVRLDPDLRAALDQRAEIENISGAEVIRRALRQHLAVERTE